MTDVRLVGSTDRQISLCGVELIAPLRCAYFAQKDKEAFFYLLKSINELKLEKSSKTRKSIMLFAIKEGSSKEISIDSIKNLIDSEYKISVPINPNNYTEYFIEACYQLAKQKKMTAIIYLDHIFTMDDNLGLKSKQLLAVKFQKKSSKKGGKK